MKIKYSAVRMNGLILQYITTTIFLLFKTGCPPTKAEFSATKKLYYEPLSMNDIR